MPKYLDLISSNRFWEASENDIFPLPIVAIALGIGRNRMIEVPVISLIIEKRKCYRKRDILDWALGEKEKGKDSLLLKLRAKNSSIGKAENVKKKFYDQYYSKENGSHYWPTSLKGETKRNLYHRLHKEWDDVRSLLNDCDDEDELLKLVKLSWEYREQFVKLRMGLPYNLRLDISNWWLEKDTDKLKEAQQNSKREGMLYDIKWNQEYLESDDFKKYLGDPEYKSRAIKQQKDIKLEIEQLKTKLKALG